MLSQFLKDSLSKATYTILEDKTYYAEIPNLRGVWANAKKLKDCRRELKEVLEEWLLLKVQKHETIPGFRYQSTALKYKHAA